jgi:RNA polymerase primary sigma factor
MEEIHDRGHLSVTKQQVSEYLSYAASNGRVRLVPISGRSASGWDLTESYKRQLGLLPPLPPPTEAAHLAATVMDKLYNWQRRALAKWEADHYHGIIEAVTGSGKTMVALAAWEHLKNKHRPLNTLIVVPTIELMNQWHARFQDAFPDTRVGRIGDHSHDDFSRFNICISTIHSAVRQVHDLLAHRHRCPLKTFLIADECHRYIEPAQFQKIRRFPFTYSLGLSATIEPYHVSGLGRIVETYTFSDAVRDELVPAFDMVNVSVELTRAEQECHEDLTEKMVDRIATVKDAFEEQLRNTPPDRFFRTLQTLVTRPDGAKEPLITSLFGIMFKRAAISYKAERKMALASQLTQLLLNDGRKKLIGFFERIRSAEDLAEDTDGVDSLDVQTASDLQSSVLEAGANWCKVLHSGLHRNDRNAMLAEFKSTKVAALLACRVLDEGVDVPEIDAALLVASTQSKRQRIQRIGRALRRGDGQKRPLIITLFVPETNDRCVTEDDALIFGSAATIYRVTEKECLPTVRHLLNRR